MSAASFVCIAMSQPGTARLFFGVFSCPSYGCNQHKREEHIQDFSHFFKFQLISLYTSENFGCLFYCLQLWGFYTQNATKSCDRWLEPLENYFLSFVISPASNKKRRKKQQSPQNQQESRTRGTSSSLGRANNLIVSCCNWKRAEDLPGLIDGSCALPAQ
jgi:hypothetical protein